MTYAKEDGKYGMPALQIIKTGLTIADVEAFADDIGRKEGWNRSYPRHQFVADHRASLDTGETLALVRNSHGTDYIRHMSKLSPLSDAEATAVFGAQRREEKIRLIRAGQVAARPSDFPEIPEVAWNSGTITLRGHRHELNVGDHVCIDRENFARVMQIVSVDETSIEDEDDRPIRVTRIKAEGVQIKGSYDVLPGADTRDLAGLVLKMKSDAVRAICS